MTTAPPYRFVQRLHAVQVLWALCLLCMAAPVLAQSLPQRAAEAIEAGRYGEAITTLNRVLKENPGHVDALLLRAYAYEGRREYAYALADYERVLRLEPNNETAQKRATGTRAMYAQEEDQRLTLYKRQVEARPEDPGALLQYADALYANKNHRAAADYYGRYLKYGQPVPAIVQRYLIAIANYPGDNDLGAQVATTYLNQFPTSDDLYMRLGFFRYWQNNRPAAIQAFEKALALNSKNEDAANGLRLARAPEPEPPPTAKPKEFVVDRLARALAAKPEDIARRYALIDALLKHDRAVEAYEHLIYLEADEANTSGWQQRFARTDRALAQRPNTRHVYATERLRRRLRIDPADPDVRFDLVEELIAAKRLHEAYALLTEPDYAAPQAPRYQDLMTALLEAGTPVTDAELAAREAEVEAAPFDQALRGKLIAAYLSRERVDDALEEYAFLLAQNPKQDSLRLAYGATLYQNGLYHRAFEQAQWLMDTAEGNDQTERLYILSGIASGAPLASLTERTRALVGRHPQDAALRLDLAEAYIARSRAAEALTHWQAAQDLDLNGLLIRSGVIYTHIERAVAKAREDTLFALLARARTLRRDAQYPAAISQYHAYYAERGTPRREEVIELAYTHWADGDLDEAIKVLTALQAERETYDVAKLMGKIHLSARRYETAAQLLAPLAQERPRDFETTLMLCDAYREAKRFDDATEVCQRLLTVSTASKMGLERMTLLQTMQGGNGAYAHHRFGLQVAPTSDLIYGTGNRTIYQRWTRGVIGQLLLPIPVTLTGGYATIYLHGSRRLVPDAELITQRLREYYAGINLDFTRPDRSSYVGYTNRLQGRLGVHEYDFGRKAGFGSLRYLRHVAGRYTATVGVESTEGSLSLWSPAGGTFNLRLTRMDAGLNALPRDSLLWIQTQLAVNIVNDNFGSSALEAFSNYGIDINLSGGYRVLPQTYAGLAYRRLSYRTAVDIYYAPSRYETYYIWVGHRHTYAQKWFLQARGALGISPRTRGTVARLLESSLTYALAGNLSAGVTLNIGQSHRPFYGTTSRIDGPYTTFIFQAAVYWTL